MADERDEGKVPEGASEAEDSNNGSDGSDADWQDGECGLCEQTFNEPDEDSNCFLLESTFMKL